MRGFMILLFLALLVVLAMWAGWFDVSTTDQGGKTSITATIHKDEVKRDVDSTEQKVRDLGGKDKTEVKVESTPADDQTTLDLKQDAPVALITVNKERVELAPGETAEITVTRSGALHQENVMATAEEGTGLRAHGALFENGQASKIVVIEVPAGASDGLVTIEYKGQTEGVYVDVIEPGQKRDVPVTDTTTQPPIVPQPVVPEPVVPPGPDTPGNEPVKPPVLPDSAR